jgi:hypothetical protein
VVASESRIPRLTVDSAASECLVDTRSAVIAAVSECLVDMKSAAIAAASECLVDTRSAAIAAVSKCWVASLPAEPAVSTQARCRRRQPVVDKAARNSVPCRVAADTVRSGGQKVVPAVDTKAPVATLAAVVAYMVAHRSAALSVVGMAAHRQTQNLAVQNREAQSAPAADMPARACLMNLAPGGWPAAVRHSPIEVAARSSLTTAAVPVVSHMVTRPALLVRRQTRSRTAIALVVGALVGRRRR